MCSSFRRTESSRNSVFQKPAKKVNSKNKAPSGIIGGSKIQTHNTKRKHFSKIFKRVRKSAKNLY
jgi:hypothetical protein